MAKLDGPGEAFTRTDALKVRPTVLLKTWKGAPVLQKWPRRRGRSQSQLQQAWVDAFAERARLLKDPLPEAFIEASALAKGTGWYYRDVLERASYGKLLFDAGERRVTTPTVSATRLTNFAITQNVDNYIPITMTTWDNNAFFDVAHPTRLTVKSPGLYLVIATLYWSVLSGTNNTRLRLRVNRATDIGWEDRAGSAQANFIQNVITVWYFHADDYVELVAFKNNAGNSVQINNFALVAITPEALI